MADRIIQMKDNQGNNLFPLVKISPSILEGNYLPITGGILTGDLILKGDPTSLLMPATKQYVDNKFATKQYVDNKFGNYLPLSGGTLTGVLNINVTSSSGSLNITSNGNTLSIGSMNEGQCHIQNSIDIPFYFNRGIDIDGDIKPYIDATQYLGDSSHRYLEAYVQKSIKTNAFSQSWISGRDTASLRVTDWNQYHAAVSMKTENGSWDLGVYFDDKMYFTYCPDTYYNTNNNTGYAQIRVEPAGKLYGAVWNDYAEYRKSDDNEPGRVVMEDKKGVLQRATERLQSFAGVVSDTFGFAIGETDEAKTPLAVAGRVLVYPYRPREEYNPGDCVCAAPDGTVDIMTRQEIRDWPDRIVGTVSEIPDYETWGTGNVEVNGRIWIKVR